MSTCQTLIKNTSSKFGYCSQSPRSSTSLAGAIALSIASCLIEHKQQVGGARGVRGVGERGG